MTGDAASAPVRGRVREIAAWGALGPAAIALFWAAAEQWPKGGNAWQGLAGGAAVCLVLGAYLGGGVKAGETLDVTEHGRLVAALGPPRDEAVSPYERLKAEGRIKPATVRWEDVPLPLPAGPGPSLSEVLHQMRDEDER